MTQSPAHDASLTIAVPVHERTLWLDRALESAARQADPGVPMDIVVVDDASAADVRGYVARVAEGLPRPIRYLRNEQNLGLCGNWNRCLELGPGAVVNILHSDERLDRGAAARAMAAFRSDRALAMVCSGKGRAGASLAAGEDAVREVMKGVQPVSSVFLRTSLMDRSRAFDPAFPYFPDLELFPRLASQFRVRFVNDPPLADAEGHSHHHMFRTWEQDDFIDSFAGVRRAGYQLAGDGAAEAEQQARADAAHACQHILWKSWRGGKRRLARRYYEVAVRRFGFVPGRAERLLHVAGRVPGVLAPALAALELKWKLSNLLGARASARSAEG